MEGNDYDEEKKKGGDDISLFRPVKESSHPVDGVNGSHSLFSNSHFHSRSLFDVDTAAIDVEASVEEVAVDDSVAVNCRHWRWGG